MFLTKKNPKSPKKIISNIENQQEDVILRFESFLKSERDQKSNGLSKTRIFQRVYPYLGYDHAKMHSIGFLGMKALEEYVVCQELRKGEYLGRGCLIKSVSGLGFL